MSVIEHFSKLIKERKALDNLEGVPVALLPNDLDYLSHDERVKLHRAKLALPTFGELSNQARDRLKTRIRGRNNA